MSTPREHRPAVSSSVALGDLLAGTVAGALAATFALVFVASRVLPPDVALSEDDLVDVVVQVGAGAVLLCCLVAVAWCYGAGLVRRRRGRIP